MNRTCVPSRGSMVGLLCVFGVLAGCSDDATGPVVDPAFDPSFAVDVVENVFAAVETSEVQPMMGNIVFALSQAAPAAARATALPGTGSTYIFNEAELRWEIDSDRAGAPAGGVRFV